LYFAQCNLHVLRIIRVEDQSLVRFDEVVVVSYFDFRGCHAGIVDSIITGLALSWLHIVFDIAK